MGDRRCHQCGALVGATAEWCGQCYARLDPDQPVEREFAHADASPDAFPRYEYSRTQSSATTFGLTGRILLTLLTCVVPILWFVSVSIIGAAAIWAVIVWPIALASIWKKARKPTVGGS
jgi:hypothetical protein